MEREYNILHYGISGVTENWAFSLNQTSFIDRVYYIIEEGAGYIKNNQKKYFIKNHLYVINHSADIKYFVDNYNFRHAFIDYITEDIEEYNDVIEIFPDNNVLTKCDTQAMLYFLQNDKSVKYGQSVFPYCKRLVLILKSILCDVEDLLKINTIKNSSVADAVKYIHKFYTEDVSVKMLAQKAHLSINQFSRVFFKATGFTPYQYIKEYRLNMALAMLKEGMSVAEVAQNCAFLSTSAFSNSFKKRFGKSPTQFVVL